MEFYFRVLKHKNLIIESVPFQYETLCGSLYHLVAFKEAKIRD